MEYSSVVRMDIGQIILRRSRCVGAGSLGGIDEHVRAFYAKGGDTRHSDILCTDFVKHALFSDVLGAQDVRQSQAQLAEATVAEVQVLKRSLGAKLFRPFKSKKKPSFQLSQAFKSGTDSSA
eukprot:m.1517361 g.1517361  ORF g.1517361 m.1517361 type:complete len:122 (-) comp25218_c1_seq41:1553-1918(-)